MTELQSPVSPGGNLTSALFDAGTGDKQDTASLLDDIIPLKGASHADVVEYLVETPIRYAECVALLSDGRKVGLQEPRKFKGWSQHSPDRSLLFRSNGKHCELAVEERLRGEAPGCIREVFLEARPGRRSSLARKFIGVDGNFVMLHDLPANA